MAMLENRGGVADVCERGEKDPRDMTPMQTRFSIVLITVASGILATSAAPAGVSYQDPAGGWRYKYEGTFNDPVVDMDFVGDVGPAGYGDGNLEEALDGTWFHKQASKWDGSAPGNVGIPPDGASPGGAAALMEGDTNFIRVQDAGNPEHPNHGWIQGSQRPANTNRRVYFGHNMQQDGTLSGSEELVLNNGITISFRMRIPISGPLDNIYGDDGVVQPWFNSHPADYNQDGAVNAADQVLWRDTLGSGTDLRANGDDSGNSQDAIDQADYNFWRANFGQTSSRAGRGYPIHDEGRGMVTIVQNDPDFLDFDNTIAFSLITADDIADLCGGGATGAICTGSGNGGLVMNNRNGTSFNNNVDSFDSGALNILEIPDAQLAEWREIWITIQANTSGGGTHQIDVYTDGSTMPTTLHVTMSGPDNAAYSREEDPYLEFGMSSTDLFGSFDMDFISYQLGVHTPVPVSGSAAHNASASIPEPSTCVLAIALLVAVAIHFSRAAALRPAAAA